MKTYKVLPNTYVYPSVLIKHIPTGVCFGVASRAIHTIDEYWEFTENQFKVVEYSKVCGLEKYGTGAIGSYFWVRLPKAVNIRLDTNSERYKGTPFMEPFRVYGFYVHISRVKTIDGNNVFDLAP